MANFHLLSTEGSSCLAESQFEIANLGVSRSETDRHAEFKTDAIAGLVTVEQIVIEAGGSAIASPRSRWCVIGVAKQLIAEAVDRGACHQIQPWLCQALSGFHLKLQALDVPLLLAKFDTPCECFDQAGAPVR